MRDDFSAALAAYERFSAEQEPAGERCPTRAVNLALPNDAARATASGACLASDGDRAEVWRPLDAVVIAGSVHRAGEPDGLGPASTALDSYLQRLIEQELIAERSLVYAIAISFDDGGGSGTQAVSRWQGLCKELGLPWGGAVVITDGDLLCRLMRAPRLGAWRRPVAEAVDRLVAAARLGCTLADVERLLDKGGRRTSRASNPADGTLTASPAHLWRSIMRLVAP